MDEIFQVAAETEAATDHDVHMGATDALMLTSIRLPSTVGDAEACWRSLMTVTVRVWPDQVLPSFANRQVVCVVQAALVAELSQEATER